MSARPPRLAGQGGWSLPELLVVLGIVSLLANIAIPATTQALKRAQAAAIAEDFSLVRQAVLDHYQHTSAFPAEVAAGVVPKEISATLKNKVSFTNPKLGITYDWDYWVNKKGAPSQKSTGVLVGLSVTTTDARLVSALKKTYTGCLANPAKNKYTFVIEPVPGVKKPC